MYFFKTGATLLIKTSLFFKACVSLLRYSLFTSILRSDYISQVKKKANDDNYG